MKSFITWIIGIAFTVKIGLKYFLRLEDKSIYMLTKIIFVACSEFSCSIQIYYQWSESLKRSIMPTKYR